MPADLESDPRFPIVRRPNDVLRNCSRDQVSDQLSGSPELTTELIRLAISDRGPI